MSKIYNEITIDMNPESSSFEEVVHEDSFEYDGDTMMMMPYGTSGFDSNEYMYQQSGGGEQTGAVGADPISYGEWAEAFGEGTTMEEKINYLRRATGDEPVIINGVEKWGNSGTLKDVTDAELAAKMNTMPQHFLDELSVNAARDKYGLSMGAIGEQKQLAQGKFKTLSSTLGAERQKLQSAGGVSGIRAPGQGGFKGMEELETAGYGDVSKNVSDIYGLGLKEQQAGLTYGTDIYGLQQSREQELVDWLGQLTW